MLEKSATLDELSDMLAESDLFTNLDYAEISAAARYFNLIEAAEGGAIFREGDAGMFMCVVNSGKVAIWKSDQDGNDIKIATLHSGRAFGEMAVLDGERRSASCIAVTECTLLTLSKDSLDQMLHEIPAIAAKVVRSIAVSLSRRLRMVDGELVDRRSNNAY